MDVSKRINDLEIAFKKYRKKQIARGVTRGHLKKLDAKFRLHIYKIASPDSIFINLSAMEFIEIPLNLK